jgi:hypothetical protein
MTLSEQQQATLAELRAKGTLTQSERGRLFAVRMSGRATSAEDAELARLIGENPLLPKPSRPASNAASSSAMDLDRLYTEHPDADPKAVRVLVAQGVRADQFGRALRLLDSGELTLDEARKEAAQLRADLPDLFTEDAQPVVNGGRRTGLPDGRPASTPVGTRQKGQSAQAAGRALAERQGWLKPDGPDAA